MARSNGEGTYYQRKDGGGRWEAAAWFDTIDGGRKRRSFYGKTKEEARQKLVEAQTKALQGIRLPDYTWKLGEYLDYWLHRAKRRPLTYRRHEAVVRLYLKPGLGHWKLDYLSVQAVQDFLDRLQADGKSVATVHQVRKVLSAALTYAMRQEILFRNVARLVELSRYKPKEAQHWTLDETVQFLNAARSDPLYPTFALLALYGLRRGEVLGIRWRDVDFERGVLCIRQQVQRINGKLQQVELKTDSSRRDAPLLSTARDVLVKRRAEQAAERVAAGSSWQGVDTEDGLVFTTKTGRPLESRNLYRSFLRICEQHGIRRITIHGMRHTNATTQKSLQVHDRDIQANLGHGDVRTTGIYEHVDMDSKRDALEKVERQLFEQQVVYSRGRSRQKLPSNKKKLHQLGEVLSGGSSQTRTGDTRLFRPILHTFDGQVTSVRKVRRCSIRVYMVERVTVRIAVKTSRSQFSSWRDIRLPERPKEWSS